MIIEEICRSENGEIKKINYYKLYDGMINSLSDLQTGINENKNKMETELTVKNEDLQKAYDNGCDEVKKTLKNLYPDFFVRKLPKSWGEYCEITNHVEDVRVISRVRENDIINLNFELPLKYTALYKLELLRDYYNDGWVPDWKNDEIKHCYNSSKFLVFKTYELKYEFLTNFKDLIEEAEDLI